jgi:hypothetical protein
MHTVVETPAYLDDAGRLFTDDERAAIVELLAAEPKKGVPEEGGCCPGLGRHPQDSRRLRRAWQAGGGRVICPFGGAQVPVFLLAAFGKNEKADLTARERTELGKMAAAMLADYRRRK